MSTFSFDTSGVVYVGSDHRVPGGHVEWSDLSPFVQGYVEALFASLAPAAGTFKTAPLIERQREWVMDYMARNSFGGAAKSFDTGTTYDDGAEFCEEFQAAFPGRKKDPNLSLASRRLAKLLRGMWMDNLVTRGRLGNEKYLPQEPSWQYAYSLFPRECGIRKRALEGRERCQCGALTPITEACCVGCGRTKRQPGFSDLDPSALALILRDCEERPPGFDPDRSEHAQGGDLWAELRRNRQPYLSEAGKVCLREAA